MSPKQPSSLFFITLAFLLSILCNSALAQDWIVIDDADPAIVYYGDWKQGPCSDCYSPPTEKLTNGTWHVGRATSGRTGFSVQFEGNQVLVGILVNDLEPDVKTDMVIVLDGEARNFYHISENTGAITTNIIAYFSHDIPLAVHTLSVEASANSLILFDYIAYDSGKLANTGGGSTSGSQGPSSITSTSTSGSLVSITSNSGGPSGTKTTSGSSGTGLTSTFSRAGTSIDVATITALNVQAFTVPLFTTTDAEGRTYYPPELTALPNGSDPSNVGSGNSNGTSSDSSTPFSPALAGAIGAAVAALAAVLVVVFMFCMRRRRRLASQARPGSAEPYILAGSSTNTTPSSQSTNLSLSAEPIPYPGSALGLYNSLPAGVAGIGANGRPVHDLLSSPPPNTLASPISPNLPYPYSSMNTPITPNPNHTYLYTGVMPSPLSPQGYGGPTSGYPPPEKPSRHTSLVHQPPQLRSSVRQMHPRPRDWEIEEESIIQNLQPTPLPVPRVTTTDTTTNLTNTTTQTPTSAMPPIISITPTSALPSPAFTGPFPSPHPSTRRSRSRPKEYLDLPAELQIPLPPLQNTYPLPNFNVPILREPNAGMRRGRRRNTESAAQAQHAPIQGQGGLVVPLQEAVMTENGLEYGRLYDPYSGAYNGGPVLYRHGTMGHERSVSEDNDARLQGYHPSQHHHEAYHGMMQNIHNLAPVVRRVSLTHPAPPAYSPPRLIRNADPERDML